MGLLGTSSTSDPLLLTVVLVDCAMGERPTNVERTAGEPVRSTLDPRVLADDHFLIRQSLRLFQRYVHAITDGASSLEVAYHRVATCAAVGYSRDRPVSGLTDYTEPLRALPEEVTERTDFWWVLYPSNVPSDPIFDETAFITGGMGGYGAGAPVFIIDDLWLVRKPPHLGRGDYSEVERRVYLPQWLQHEFFHHLFRTWPQFALEATGHQWFDRSTWPSDFVGEWEPD